MSWSRAEVEALIQGYRNNPCLYAVETEEYRNKHARVTALTEIRSLLAQLKPGVTVAEIKNKYNSLRTTLLSEYRKVEMSRQSGVDSDKIYKPTLWYYEKLSFILEHKMPRKSHDSLSISETEADEQASSQISQSPIDDDRTEVDDELDDDFTIVEIKSRSSPISESPYGESSRCTTPSSQLKRKRTDTSILEEMSGTLNGFTQAVLNINRNSEQQMPHAAFGQYVISKMAQLPTHIAEDVEEEIINVLFRAKQRAREEM